MLSMVLEDWPFRIFQLALGITISTVSGQVANSATITKTSVFGISADSQAEGIASGTFYAGSTSLEVAGFDASWGTLSGVKREVNANFLVSDVSNGRFKGSEVGYAPVLQFLTPSYQTGDAADAFRTNAAIGATARGFDQQTAPAEGELTFYSGDFEPVLDSGFAIGSWSDDLVSGSPVDVQAWFVWGGSAGRPQPGGSVTGTYTVTYEFEPAPDYEPVVLALDSNGDQLFDTQFPQTPSVDYISILEVTGQPVVISEDGSRTPINGQTQLGIGDVIETAEGESVTLFIDGQDFFHPEDSTLQIEEWLFSDEDEPTDKSTLKRIFEFTAQIIGDEDTPTEYDCDCFGSIGFRGDAAEIIQELDPVNAEDLDAAVVGTFASPVSLTAQVQVPTDPFDLYFEYGFLDGAGTLDVLLGDTSIFSIFSDASRAGEIFSADLFLDDFSLLTGMNSTLTFTFEGATGENFFLDSVNFPGLQNGGFDFLDFGWSSGRPSQTELVGVYSGGGVAPVPLPATLFLFLSSLFVAACGLKWRNQMTRKCV